MYILRDYQKMQLSFLEEHLPICNVCSIQSGTGSGKSIVMLEFAKRFLAKNPLQNVIISTGFNRLVFDLEQKASEFGLDSYVLVGSLAVNCPTKMMGHYKIFTEEPHLCGNEHKSLDTSTDNWEQKRCPFCTNEYRNHVQKISSARGSLIITNHSTLLVHQETFANVGLVIIDEAHTFGNFYDSYLELKLDASDMRELAETITSIGGIMSKIIDMNIRNNRPLPQQQIDAIVKKCKSRQFAAKVEKFFTTERNSSNFVEFDDGQYTLSQFYKHFELKIKAKFILFSATLDKFTLEMFGVRQVHQYVERKMFCDYSKSEFIAIPRQDFLSSLKSFLNLTHKRGLKIGCILSTTIRDMRAAQSIDGYNGYKMYTDRIEFANAPSPKILVGSRGLFQGIDLPELQFVCLNKLPFPNYNEKAKALQNYLTDNGTNGYDSWNNFVVPKCENDISQSLGRLWRTPSSSGIVAVFDDRIERFKYMVKHTMHYQRHGIGTFIMNNDDEIIEWSMNDD